jgi:predicted transposase YbfD/YdcC
VLTDRVATTVDKGHGRVEKRTLRTTSILTVHEKWSGLKQGFELTRERTTGGQTTVEVVYGITSLSAAAADAGRLLAFVRDHWHIENALHYVRDVTLGEDACRVRKDTAPQVLAALRNAVVHLLATVEGDSRPAAIEYLQMRPDEAKKLIGIPHTE